jgi:hypothetical protein
MVDFIGEERCHSAWRPVHAVGKPLRWFARVSRSCVSRSAFYGMNLSSRPCGLGLGGRFNVRVASQIDIGAAVARCPLPHHRTYGPVPGGSRSYTVTRRPTKADRAISNRHWKARQKGPWPLRNTRGRVRCRRYCLPAANAPPVQSVPRDGAGVLSIAARWQP